MGNNNSSNDSKSNKPAAVQRRGSQILSHYLCLRKIGKGAFASVYLVRRIKDNKIYAMKVIDTLKLDVNELKYAKSEVEIMKKLRHRNIVRQYQLIEDDGRIYLIMDYMDAGNMFDMVKKRPFSEKQISAILKAVAEGLLYCHKQGITHRDLKLQHILLRKTDKRADVDHMEVKLADFGLAKFVNSRELMHTMCGSPSYVAPEVLLSKQTGGYNHSVDMWSFGIMMYLMLTGERPFRTDQPPSILFEQIKRGKYKQDPKLWPKLTASAKDLLSRLLVTDPTKRLTAENVLQHPWIAMGMASDEIIHRTKESMEIAAEVEDTTEVQLDAPAPTPVSSMKEQFAKESEEEKTQVRLDPSDLNLTPVTVNRVLQSMYGKRIGDNNNIQSNEDKAS